MAKKDINAEEKASAQNESIQQPEGEFPDEQTMLDMEKEISANSTIKKYVIGSMVVGLIPAPGLDIAAITAIQLKMLHTLSSQYEIPFSRDIGKSVIASLVGSLGATSIARGTFGSIVKAIPVVGSIAGAITLPAVAGASTYAIGKVFVQHFEAGGTFLDFDPKEVRSFFKQKYMEGQDIAKELKPEAEKQAKDK